ncbi:hypothetical protein [Emcibacter nanhaiensis]|uniref:Transporter substrate-binding domain-containing protein n=1 Tax=Emcibacter nanhaiensis TaxID=1505037 RepID=A0A501PIE2_9PROT|nr:hypothetical protein [Emcibacter nanhaiensis]TPD59771.1 hypothetical protein FIV46_09775 [Emcibacter nanhaiensis]
MIKVSGAISLYRKMAWIISLTLILQAFSIRAVNSETAGKPFDICTPLELTYSVGLRDIVEKSYREFGYDVHWHILPANRCIAMVDRGILDADLVRTTSVIEHYQNLILIPVRLITIKIDLYGIKRPDVPPPEPEILLADENIAVAYPRNSLLIEKMVKNPASIGTDDGAHMLKLLRNGRVRLILLPKVELNRLQKKGVDMSDLVLIRENYIEYPGFHVVNRKHKDLVDRLAAKFLPAIAEANIPGKQ